MWTFFIALILLIAGYLVYSRVSEKVFAVDNRETPAIASPDGVDKIPLKKSRAFLIELLNIAGTGPIFGAISGALFGPIVFFWIVLGCILGGAVHDYYSGMISSRNDGKSIVEVSGKYFGKIMKIVIRVFSVILLILVTAVFVVSPSSLLSNLTGNVIPAWCWMVLILAYYFLATILPIDKIIGKAYPIFGVTLIAMALAVIMGLMFHPAEYPMIELIGNIKDYSASIGKLPWWPFMFTTVACGAVSGFHATQSPMMAKCIRNEKEGRQVFYGAMVAEGVIALIWAAAAMAFFKTNTAEGATYLSGLGGGNSNTVQIICSTLLGPVGTVLAIIGVVICPITSGDTALRSARLIIGEGVNLDQRRTGNRILLTIPLFVVVVGISLWNFLDPRNFNVLWSWFAWCNQVLAALSLWLSSCYLLKEGKYKYGSLLTAAPASFMTAIVLNYIIEQPQIMLGRVFPRFVSTIISVSVAVILLFLQLYFILKKRKSCGNHDAELKFKQQKGEK